MAPVKRARQQRQDAPIAVKKTRHAVELSDVEFDQEEAVSSDQAHSMSVDVAGDAASSDDVDVSSSEDGEHVMEGDVADAATKPAATTAKTPKSSANIPPSADEILALRETEELFKNNVFKWQMEQLLKEAAVPYAKCTRLEKTFWQLKTVLEGVQDQPEAELSHIVAHLSKTHGITIPFPSPAPRVDAVKYTFGFRKPASLHVVGSYMTRTCCRGGAMNADLVVEMPKSLFQDKDHMNCRYFHKRAYYVAMLAAELKRKGGPLAMHSFRFAYLNGDERRPIVVMESVRDSSMEENFSATGFTVRIIPCIAEDLFALPRLAPSRNCLRPVGESSSATGAAGAAAAAALTSTPRYNNALLSEMQFTAHLNFIHHWTKQSEDKAAGAFQEAVILMKTWLRQRGMHTAAAGGVNGFLLTMLMTWLFTAGGPRGARKLSVQWSSYQLLRVFFAWLAEYNIKTQPIFMTPNGEALHTDEGPEGGYTRAAFVKNFDVVVVDPSGRINLAGDVSIAEWEALQHEARMATAYLGETMVDRFDALFSVDMTKPLRRFDNTAVLPACPISTSLVSAGKRLDFGNSPRAVVYAVASLLRRALTDRVRLVAVSHANVGPWAVGERAPLQAATTTALTIGLILDPVQSTRVVDQGPPAEEDPKATKEFRLIWGDKAELRRFKDGSIVESVVWEMAKNAGLDQRSTIVEQAVTYLLRKHLRLGKAGKIEYFGNQLWSTIVPASMRPGAAHADVAINAFQPVMTAFDTFVKQVKELEGLPLAIHEIRAAHPALRYASTFIPQPESSATRGWHTDVMEAVIELESSGKWPADLRAIQKTKAAFYIAIANLYEQRYPGSSVAVVRGMTSEDDPEGICLLAGGCIEIATATGYRYRCRIRHDYELTLLDRGLKQAIADEDDMKQMQYTKASELYQHCLVQVPLLSQYVHALVHEHPALSHTIRLLKRWVASHWMLTAQETTSTADLPLTSYFPEEVLELVAVRVFTDPAPYTAPASAWSGFLRCLALLVNWNWKESPLTVELQQGVLSAETLNAINDRFSKHRADDPLGTHASMYVVPVAKPLVASKEDDDETVMGIVPELWMDSRWTHASPSLLHLQRLQKLALASLRHVTELSESLLQKNHTAASASTVQRMFIHPVGDYDVLIHLKPEHCTRLFESELRPRTSGNVAGKTADSTLVEEEFKNVKRVGGSKARVADPGAAVAVHDPVAMYLEDMKSILGDTALLFHDRHGGRTIGVVFDPTFSHEPRPFKVGLRFDYELVKGSTGSEEAAATKKSQKKPTPFVKANVRAIVQQLVLAGDGLVAGWSVRTAA